MFPSARDYLRSFLLRGVCLPALFLNLALCPVAGQSPPVADILHALRLTKEQSETLKLDGLLSESFWQEAALLTGLRQQEPDEGQPATEETEVRIAYDEESLYVGVLALDSDPDRIVSRVLERDMIMGAGGFGGLPTFTGDDAVAILFDPFHDSRNAVVFATNPNGAEFDALLTDEGTEFNVDWRGVWEVKATRIPEGWSAEFAIPFRTLRYPREGADGQWGFNVFRTIRRKNEYVLWRSWSRDNEGFHRVSRAGHIAGLTDLPPPSLNIEIKPYALAGIQQARSDAGEVPSNGELDFGLDLKSELRPGLVLDLTLNTDFAQVEVDQEQINLTRFSLFYPEKRDFFLENSGIFDLGIRGKSFEPPPYLLFFSRRIGIHKGEEVPILGGARLTGRLGRQTVGFLNVVTDRVGEISRTNYAVARMKRDVGDNSFVGWMLTDRRDARSSNTVAAIDASAWLGRLSNLRGFLSRSFTSGTGGDDLTYALTLDYDSDRLALFAQHLTIGSEAQTDLGFVARNDIRRTSGFVQFLPRPGLLGIRTFEIFLNGSYVSTIDGRMQDREVGFFFEPRFESGDYFELFYNPATTRIDEGFVLADSVPINPGTFDATGSGIRGGTSPHRAVAGAIRLGESRFYGGELRYAAGGIGLSLGPRLSLELAHAWSRVEVPTGGFTSNITYLRAVYAFSTRLTTHALVQYNRLENTFSSNVRLNLIHRPGSDLFIVLTEERGGIDSVWDVQDRGLAFKLTYLARF